MSHPQPNDVLSSPPFVVVDGVMNIRTIGGYTTATPGAGVKPQHIFRSADLSRITDAGKEQLRELGVKVVFDLRSEQEIARDDPRAVPLDGIRFVTASVYTQETYHDMALKMESVLKRYEQHALETFKEEYFATLKIAGPAFSLIFQHLRDKPDEPCLVHCVSGKDRTGLFAAVLLMLLGVADQDIARDYGLTTLAFRPFLGVLEARFRQVQMYNAHWEGFMNMGSAREETMSVTLETIRERFGGVEAYLRDYVGLGADDVAKIRQNLLVPASSSS